LPGTVIPEDLIDPPVFPVPPVPPNFIIPVEPTDDDEDDDDDDDDIIIPKPWPGIIKPTDDEKEDEENDPIWVPGGGGIVIDNDRDEPPGVFSPRIPETNFDDYADLLVNNSRSGHTPNIDFKGKTYNVTRFYEVTHSAYSANRAMKNTRNAYRNVGLRETRAMPKLVEAEEMFAGAAIYEFEASYPELTIANEMFSGCESLEVVTFTGNKGAKALEETNDMFANCDVLEKASLGKTLNLTSSSYTFYNCKSLKKVSMSLSKLSEGEGFFYNCGSLKYLSDDASNLSSLSVGDYMFYKCASLNKYPKISTSLSSARGMFSGCSSLPQFNDFAALSNLQNGRQMFYGCSNITHVDLNFPVLTDGSQMFANCPITSISETVSFPALKYGNGFLGGARLDLTSASKVIQAVTKLGPMEPKNGNVNNGFHLGVNKDNPGENTELTWDKFLENWGYNAELGIIELDNGWQIVLNQN
jgi:hypothetical protein